MKKRSNKKNAKESKQKNNKSALDVWMKRLPIIVLVLVTLIPRLYRIDQTILDWHSFRQADTASVTREYVKHGIDLLEPRYHDLSNIQSGQENPEGYRMVEFPVVQVVLALIIKTFPALDLVLVSRLGSVFASLITSLALYKLGTFWSGKRVGMLAALTFALLPYAIFYSRAVLPEPYLLAASTTALLTWTYWLNTKRWQWYLTSWILFASALLLKPFAAFLFPVFFATALTFQKTHLRRLILPLGFFITTFIPLLAWRNWIAQYSQGIPASDWLLNGNGIRLRPAWFRWLGYERITKLILGYVGIVFLPLAFLTMSRQEKILYGSWWIGVIGYLIVVASGNVQHDYYQNLLLPILCLSVARGAIMLERLLQKRMSNGAERLIVIPLWIAMLLLPWNQVGGYYQMNHTEYLRAGKAVDMLVPQDGLVIAPAFGDTQFLFQTNRRGWPIGFEIDKKIALGAQYYVSTSYDDEARELEEKYFTIVKTDEYIILDLTKPMAK